MKKNQRNSKAEVVSADKAPAPKPKNRSAVTVMAPSEADMDAAIARTLTRPEVGSAAVIEAWSQGGHDVNELVAELSAQVTAVNGGEMARAEGMLIAQAHTLDAIFVNLMRRAMNQSTMPHWDAYMRMGLKAQSQCRSTLQALADLKNPPVVFAKQANIANGPQQVNNGVVSGHRATDEGFREQYAQARAHGKTESEQTRLLQGDQHGGSLMDAGATRTTAAGNPALEALGAVNRPKECGRQGEGPA